MQIITIKGQEIEMTDEEMSDFLLEVFTQIKGRFKPKAKIISEFIPPRKCRYGTVHQDGEGCRCWMTEEEKILLSQT